MQLYSCNQCIHSRGKPFLVVGQGTVKEKRKYNTKKYTSSQEHETNSARVISDLTTLVLIFYLKEKLHQIEMVQRQRLN